MKKLYVSILIPLLAVTSAFAAKPDAESILAEGVQLYRLEKASWYATDDFVASYPRRVADVGGYISYQAEDGAVNTVFYHKDDADSVLARYKFTALPDKAFVFADTVDPGERELEKRLITIRQDALDRMVENTDDFFEFYPNTAINFIPVPVGREGLVYIVTAPTASGKVVLGGDYELAYNSRNRLKGRRKVHETLIELPARSGDPDHKMSVTSHSHLHSSAIEPTDICTLLLYKDFVEWKKHVVVGRGYVSVLDLDNQTLEIFTTEEWERLNER